MSPSLTALVEPVRTVGLNWPEPLVEVVETLLYGRKCRNVFGDLDCPTFPTISMVHNPFMSRTGIMLPLIVFNSVYYVSLVSELLE